VGANLADLVTDSAVRSPDAPAIICADRTTSWSELERLVRAAAGGLTARGLLRGARVGLLVSNSLEFVVSYFGVLRAGLVAVPINIGYTEFEVRYLLEQSGAELLICDATTSVVAAEATPGVPIVQIGSEDWRRLLVGKNPPPMTPTDPEELAVLMFTSGTSGRPKGAMLSHRALGANLDQLAALDQPHAMTAEDVVLIVLPLFHSYALNGALGLVAKTGATAVITSRFEAADALSMVAKYSATVVTTAPPVYTAWLAQPGLDARLSRVRLLISGAAPLSGRIFSELLELGGLPVWEGYGMTEASPVITSTLVSGRAKPGSVGVPLPGIELKICDEAGNEVDDGDPGEVVIRGGNLFSGYWPDGDDGPDSDGWWRTSDVAILDHDGDLRLVDRRNDLIIVSGFNVYPREVEEVIGMLPGVTEVAVLGIPHPYTGETVKALLVASDDLTSDAIVAFCQTRLARFKCPTVVSFVDQLPHSGTGKISKGSLRERLRLEVEAALAQAQSDAAEQDPAEQDPAEQDAAERDTSG